MECIDDRRIVEGDHVVAEAEAIHHPWPEVLDQHIAECNKPQQQVGGLGLAGVEADVALADVLLDEVTGQAVDPRIGHARDVTVGWLDLDHLCTEIAQHACRVRSAEHSCEVEHADAGQGPLRSCGKGNCRDH